MDITYSQAGILLAPILVMVIGAWLRDRTPPRYTVYTSLLREGIDRKPKRTAKLENIHRRDLMKALKGLGVTKYHKRNGRECQWVRIDESWIDSINGRVTKDYHIKPREKSNFKPKFDYMRVTITPSKGRRK